MISWGSEGGGSSGEGGVGRRGRWGGKEGVGAGVGVSGGRGRACGNCNNNDKNQMLEHVPQYLTNLEKLYRNNKLEIICWRIRANRGKSKASGRTQWCCSRN